MHIIEIFWQTGQKVVEHKIEGEMCKHYSLKLNFAIGKGRTFLPKMANLGKY